MKAWEYYDGIARDYDAMYESPRWILHHKLVERFLGRYLTPRMRVLDLGGGTGRWTLFFEEHGCDVLLVDPSEKMLEVAKKKGAKKLMKAYAEDLPLPDEYFDAVNLQGDVLSYVEDREKAISEIRRVLKSGGLVFATVDNFYSFVQQILLDFSLPDLKRLLRDRTARVGTPDRYFRTYTFKPEDLPFEGFELLEVRGVLVFEHREETIEKHFQEIFEVEYEFSGDRNILWRADHIFFVLKKEERGG